MGRPKQLLVYGGRTLLERAIDEASNAGLSPIIVVLGSDADAIEVKIAERAIEIVHNAAWCGGMGSSIVSGFRRLIEVVPECAGVAILLPDQPLVTADHLRAMQNALTSGDADIVAAEYSGTRGVPAFFARRMFSALASLPGDVGARHIIRNQSARVVGFSLPEAAIDIDTPADFTALEN